ncbi:MAG: Flp family type IVb pilin [Bryobacteraceae bacterium]|jgi:Flp pilus assembly pilin Flp
MQKIWHSLIRLQIWSDQHGQDLIEYAMIGGFIAVVSGMFMPGVSKDVSMVFSRIASTVTSSAATS